MKTQIFKDSIPNDIVFNLLNKINSFKTDKYYTVDVLSYKKGIYSNDIQNFMEIVKPYYHSSKQFYLERELTFPRFTTVLRQICKANNIMFSSKIKYDKSKYNIIYYIYIC
tara:strand:+ start:330 stop:662 length:333 start_codon:yes stop_codon:yes gene_type:complete